MVSIIIPVFNEDENLPILLERILESLQRENVEKYEVIFVDDGSTDKSWPVLSDLAKKFSSVRSVKLRRNFGKAHALNTGFQLAKGETVITMDADLQDDPEEIGNFLSKINEGYQLVCGWKKKRKDPLSKTIPSKIFNFVISLLLGVKLHDYNCGFKAYRSEVVKNLQLYGDLHRYIPAFAHSNGFRITELPIKHHPRKYGKSKYGVERFTVGLFDCITVVFLYKYLKRPMHFFGKFGLFTGMTGMIILIYLSLQWFMGIYIQNRPMFILSILLIILGAHFFLTGLIAELIIKISHKFEPVSIEKIIEPEEIE